MRGGVARMLSLGKLRLKGEGGGREGSSNNGEKISLPLTAIEGLSYTSRC